MDPFKETIIKYLTDPDVKAIILKIIEENLQISVSINGNSVNPSVSLPIPPVEMVQVNARIPDPVAVPNIISNAINNNVSQISNIRKEEPVNIIVRYYGKKSPREGYFENKDLVKIIENKKDDASDYLDEAKYIFEVYSETEALFFPTEAHHMHPTMFTSYDRFIGETCNLTGQREEQDNTYKIIKKGWVVKESERWAIREKATIKTSVL